MVDTVSKHREQLLYAESLDQEVEEAQTALHNNSHISIKANEWCTCTVLLQGLWSLLVSSLWKLTGTFCYRTSLGRILGCHGVLEIPVALANPLFVSADLQRAERAWFANPGSKHSPRLQSIGGVSLPELLTCRDALRPFQRQVRGDKSFGLLLFTMGHEVEN